MLCASERLANSQMFSCVRDPSDPACANPSLQRRSCTCAVAVTTTSNADLENQGKNDYTMSFVEMS
jgi:hypothetical protein